MGTSTVYESMLLSSSASLLILNTLISILNYSTIPCIFPSWNDIQLDRSSAVKELLLSGSGAVWQCTTCLSLGWSCVHLQVSLLFAGHLPPCCTSPPSFAAGPRLASRWGCTGRSVACPPRSQAASGLWWSIRGQADVRKCLYPATDRLGQSRDWIAGP